MKYVYVFIALLQEAIDTSKVSVAVLCHDKVSARKLHQHLKLSDAVLYDAGVEDFNDNSPNYRDKNLEGDNAGVVIQWADSGWINFGYSIRFAKVT